MVCVNVLSEFSLVIILVRSLVDQLGVWLAAPVTICPLGGRQRPLWNQKAFYSHTFTQVEMRLWDLIGRIPKYVMFLFCFCGERLLLF